jgi:arylesterase/paraoxonase
VVPNLASAYSRAFGDNHLAAPVEAAVLRLVKSNNFAPEILYWDNGALISILTGAAVDAKHKKLIAGGVWERHFIVCDITY